MSYPDDSRMPPYGTAAPDGTRGHAYDPVTDPELFHNVLVRRGLAFITDFLIIIGPIIALSIVFTFVGVATLGLGFALFWLLGPATVIWAFVYVASTLGGPSSATIGMRASGIEMRTWYGAPMYPLLACVHLIVFYVSVSTLSPLVLLFGFFNRRRRLLHDFVCGTVVINSMPPPAGPVIKA